MAAGDVVVDDNEVEALAAAFEVFGAEDDQTYLKFLHAIDEASAYAVTQGDAAHALRMFVLQAHGLTASFINASHGVNVELKQFKADVEAADASVD